jgi:hypothetical protein
MEFEHSVSVVSCIYVVVNGYISKNGAKEWAFSVLFKVGGLL